MKTKLKIIKNGVEIYGKIIESMPEGDAYIQANKHLFGQDDMSLTLEEVGARGLLPENATTTSEEPIMVDGVQQGTRTMYHYAKDWSVEYEDVTEKLQKETGVSKRSSVRTKCLAVIDLIAHYNEQADPATMGTIFSSPAMVGITLALLTGAPKTAKDAILLHGSTLYSSDKVAEIVGQLDAIIASEGV
jgi:hypothetical protein